MQTCYMLRINIETNYEVFFKERSVAIETLCLLEGTYPIWTVKYDYKMSRVCLSFQFPIENTDGESLIFHSYRWYRWTGYLVSMYIRAQLEVTKRKSILAMVYSAPMDNIALPTVN